MTPGPQTESPRSHPRFDATQAERDAFQYGAGCLDTNPDPPAHTREITEVGGEEDERARQLSADGTPDFHEWHLQSVFPHSETETTSDPIWDGYATERFSVSLEQEGLSGQGPQTPPRPRPKARQREFWLLAAIDRDAMVEKLRKAGDTEFATKLAECHTKQTVQRCTGCARTVTFWNRCDLVICPICQPRLSYERKKAVEWWVHEVRQPKHVVLTVRNAAVIGPDTFERFKRAIRRLRRRKVCRGWRGGFGCLEVTNEGRGWHLHAHLLVDTDWVDKEKLARQFGQLVGQEFAICHVSDARSGEFQHQVAKYVVKGNQIAQWPAEEVAAFVRALQGTRTFFTFGSLYKREAAFRAVLAGLATARRQCECGCSRFEYFSPDEWEWHQIANQPRGPDATPPPALEPALAL